MSKSENGRSSLIADAASLLPAATAAPSESASAALRDALALAGAAPELMGDCEVEALFDLLERIEHQATIVRRRLDYWRVAADSLEGSSRTREVRRRARSWR